MLIDYWAWLALIAMVFNVAKVLSIRTICRSIEPSVLIFNARLIPAVLLIIPAWFTDYQLLDVSLFWSMTVLAAVLTMIASILYVKSIQNGLLALVSPVQASVPVFMILTTYVLFDEKPQGTAFVLIMLITVSIAYVMLKTSSSTGSAKQVNPGSAVMMSAIAAFLYGISTVVDRIAISATENGAVFYSACWHVVTVILLVSSRSINYQSLIFEVRRNSKVLYFYVFVSTAAFVFQQLSVENSIQIENGVTYVKSIVMIHIAIAAMIGVSMLKERVEIDIVFANVVALFCGIGLVLVI